jgi:ribosomal protein L7/L12
MKLLNEHQAYLTPDDIAEVLDLIRAREKITAIWLIRQGTSFGLKAAKDRADAPNNSSRTTERCQWPRQASALPNQKGLSEMLKRTLFTLGALAVLAHLTFDDQYHERLMRLEVLMNLVLKRLGIDPDDAIRDPYGSRADPYGANTDPYKVGANPYSALTGASEQIKSLLMRGEKIEAIKIYREQTGVGLKQAKDYVDALERQMRGY